MANTTQSTYMLLSVPIVGQDPGPDWALHINQAIAAIDAHDHSPSHGVQITPSGLNINADLSTNNNSLTLVKSMELASQLSLLSGAAKLYMSGQDLYFNDGQSNQVRITQNGSVAISGAVGFTGLPSGTASAAYLSGPQTFRFQSATDTPANIDGSSLTIRKQVISGNGVTISAPTAISTNYSLVLPPDPSTQGGTKILRLDTSGNISSTLDVDNSTIEISSNLLQLKAAIIAALNPSGSILAYGGASAPTGYLMCDGTSYLRSTYPDLFAAIGTAFGAADGTHFNVPDFRGQFLRGKDAGTGRDPDAGTRTAMSAGGATGNNVGSIQGQATRKNGLALSDPGHLHAVMDRWLGSGDPGVSVQLISNLGAATNTGVSSTGVTLGAGDNETRPLNAYVNFIIKA